MTTVPSLPISSDSSDNGVGVYVHVPFCVRKCDYCAFSSIAGRRTGELTRPFLTAIRREIATADRLDSRRVTSIFLGGGTPSLLPPTGIAEILDACHDRMRVATDVEITLEVNPETVTAKRSASWRKAGITRISMGVQSLDDRELASLGRPHSSTRVRESYRILRQTGFANINLDILYGLPEQSPSAWRQTVRQILDLNPEHCSAYALTPEPGTPIARRLQEGSLALPDEDLVLHYEEILVEETERAGFRRYEISNYAKPGFECRHNLLYWHCADWIGFGPSAHSHLAGTRWSNTFDLSDYLSLMKKGDPRSTIEHLGTVRRIGEVLAFGFRMPDGVSRSGVQRRFGFDPVVTHRMELAQLRELGLLSVDGDAIRPTPKGLQLADSSAIIVTASQDDWAKDANGRRSDSDGRSLGSAGGSDARLLQWSSQRWLPEDPWHP